MSASLVRVLLAVLGLAPSTLLGQNLLTNGSFATNVAGWTNVGGYGSFVWSSLDAGGAAGSGSMLQTDDASAATLMGVGQCVAVQAGTWYAFSAHVRIPSGQTTTGGAGLRVFFYPAASCGGTISGDERAYGPETPVDTWLTVTLAKPAPPGALSAKVMTMLEKNEADGTRRAHYDDLSMTVTQPPSQPTTLTIPSSASIHGNGGAFFHTDLWAMNRSYTKTQTVTARFRCFTGQSCGSGTKSFQLGPRKAVLFSDVVGAGLFAAPETAGAIELTYDALLGEMSAGSRVYTPTLPAPGFGTMVPALPASEARTRTLFLGLGGNGGNLASGFRSNAGAYNPNASSVSVTFTLYNGPTGAVLGTPFTRTWGASEAYQINDIFAAVGAGSSVTTEAYLVVTSTSPVFPFVTVIDNKSSDSVWVSAGADEAP